MSGRKSMRCGGCSQATPRLLGKLWVFSVVVIVFGLLPWGLYELYTNKHAPHVIAWFSAGVFVSLAVPISIFQVAQHLQNYFNPELQRYIIRCIWMVPVYAIDSWISLRFHAVALYINSARECYEAYVIYNFYMYLLTYMRQKQPNFEEMIKRREPATHVFPCCCLTPWVMGPHFLFWVHTGPMGYVVCRIFCTILTIITAPLDMYGEGSPDPHKSYVYIAVFNSIAQTWALYCLMLLYFAFHGSKHSKPERTGSGSGAADTKALIQDHDDDDMSTAALLPPNTHIQAIVVKGVVFVSFWQSVLIAVLVTYDPKLFHSSSETWSYYRDDKNVAAAFQDWLICVEMFFAALAFRRAFSHEEYMMDAINDEGDFVTISPNKTLSFKESLGALFDTTDVRDDVMGSSTSYMSRSADAVKKTAVDISNHVVATTNKVSNGAGQVGTSLRTTFAGPSSTENTGLLGKKASTETEAGTFDQPR
eukprot:m.54917 g.54917  ORF g.54917 m.54917 type:complete len:477 (+) comp16829_c0_seq1:53-1483(+)